MADATQVGVVGWAGRFAQTAALRDGGLDAHFFGVPAGTVPPADGLALEVLRDALDDAGLTREVLQAAPVGLTVVGEVRASWLSRALGWEGACLTLPEDAVNTLAAVHLAVRSVQLGECRHAAVVLQSAAGQGAAALIFKACDAALLDGDKLRALILSTALGRLENAVPATDAMQALLTALAAPTAQAVIAAGPDGDACEVVVVRAPEPPAWAAPEFGEPRLLPLSAATPAALADLVQRHLAALSADASMVFADWCYSASLRRDPLPVRAAVLARSRVEALARLRALAAVGDGSAGADSTSLADGARWAHSAGADSTPVAGAGDISSAGGARSAGADSTHVAGAERISSVDAARPPGSGELTSVPAVGDVRPPGSTRADYTLTRPPHRRSLASTAARIRHRAVASPATSPNVAWAFGALDGREGATGLALMQRHAVFRRAFAAVDAAFSALGAPSLLDTLRRSGAAFVLRAPALAEPIVFAQQVALAALWEAWGIAPAAVLGLGVGEVTAAHVSGALTLADAAQVVWHRSQLMMPLHGSGQVLRLRTDVPTAQSLLHGLSTASLAAVLTPHLVLVGGDGPSIQQVAHQAQMHHIRHSPLPLPLPLQSSWMDSVATRLHERLTAVRPQGTRVPFVSTLHGTVTAGDALGPAHWAAHVRAPLRFDRAVSHCATLHTQVLLELSTHPMLQHPLAENLPHAPVHSTLHAGDDEHARLLHTLGHLWAHGCMPRWQALYPEPRQAVTLPAYPWQRSPSPP